MFPLPFRGVFIRSTAVTGAPADSPQLFKVSWMPGLKQGRALKKRGRQKEDKEGKKTSESSRKGCFYVKRDDSSGMTNELNQEREREAGTEGGGQESNKHRVPFLPFKPQTSCISASDVLIQRRLCEVRDWRKAVCKCHGLKKGWRDGKIKQQQRTVMHH